MTDKQIVEHVLSGKICVGVEWRSSKAARSEIEDDRTKEKKVVKTIVHQVEREEMPYEIRQEIPVAELAGFSEEHYNANPRPFTKGQQVIMVLKSYGWSDRMKKYVGKGVPHTYEKGGKV